MATTERCQLSPAARATRRSGSDALGDGGPRVDRMRRQGVGHGNGQAAYAPRGAAVFFVSCSRAPSLTCAGGCFDEGPRNCRQRRARHHGSLHGSRAHGSLEMCKGWRVEVDGTFDNYILKPLHAGQGGGCGGFNALGACRRPRGSSAAWPVTPRKKWGSMRRPTRRALGTGFLVLAVVFVDVLGMLYSQ